MRKIFIALSLLMFSSLAQAELIDGSTLSFAPGTGGVSDVLPADGSGSWIAMEFQLGSFIIVPITSLNGIVLGTTQTASSGPVFSEDIDSPWVFSGNLGVHQTLSDSNVLNSGGDTAAIDFSGWSVSWNGIPSIDMGSGAWNGNVDGVADIVCVTGSGCGNGANYILDYSATVPVGDISGFGSVRYALHLEGAISAVPVPAAVWLFGSGLLGLVSVARRKKSN